MDGRVARVGRKKQRTCLRIASGGWPNFNNRLYPARRRLAEVIHSLVSLMSTTPDGDFVIVNSDDVNAQAHEQPQASEQAVNGNVTVTPVGNRVTVQVVHQDEDETDEEHEEANEEESLEDYLAEYPSDTDDLELVHSRIKSTAPLRLPRFKNLQRLCLRQNFITTLPPEDFEHMTDLTELDVYDNRIKELGPVLTKSSKLEILDLSYNLLRSVPSTLSPFKSLKTLYLVQNKITKIENLDILGGTLKSLELGGNRIRTIENLDSLSQLEELWLGKNKISSLQGLDKLQKLRILSIQSNRITKLEHLENLTALEEFYISHNGIERLDGLDKNVKLRVLDVGNNRIESIQNISHLTQLEEFWANDNKIPTIGELETQLGHMKELETVYLEGNPCVQAEGSAYRRKVILALPQLKQLDATFVRAD